MFVVCLFVYTHITVAEFSKKGDLSQNTFGIHEIVECPRDLLYRDLLPVLGVEGGYHHAVRTTPYRLDQLVLRINLDVYMNKDGVERQVSESTAASDTPHISIVQYHRLEKIAFGLL